MGEVSFQESEDQFSRAKNVMPGGVNSPARSYDAVEGPPPFIERAQEHWIEDVDGNRYFDLVGSWGPMIFGHNHEEILNPVIEQMKQGMSFGAPTEIETEMAETIANMVPSIDVIRMVSSGTEATMSALRLIRGATGREKVVKFRGCYHGHGDSLLVEAGSGGATLGQPDSDGVPEDLAKLTITAPYGDIESIRNVFKDYGQDIAGVILEPVAGNMGLIHPGEEFLRELRQVTENHGSLLVFDEVMTGFRVASGGVQSLVDVEPDLTTLGKIIGGGMPVGAYGGREEIMREVAPDGPVYQAGTLSGNPVGMRAGLETIRRIRENPPYNTLKSAIDEFERAFEIGAGQSGIPLQFHSLGGMFSYYFTEQEVTDYESASSVDDDLFRRFHRALLENGLYFPPSYYESCFVSQPLAADESLVDETCMRIQNAFEEV